MAGTTVPSGSAGTTTTTTNNNSALVPGEGHQSQNYVLGKPFAQNLNINLVQTQTEAGGRQLGEQGTLVGVPQDRLLILRESTQRLLLHFVNCTGVALFVTGSMQTYKTLAHAIAALSQRKRDETCGQVMASGAGAGAVTKPGQRIDLCEYLTEVPGAAKLPKGETDVWKILSVCVSTGAMNASHAQTRRFYWVFQVTS